MKNNASWVDLFLLVAQTMQLARRNLGLGQI